MTTVEIKIALIGGYEPDRLSHPATLEALGHAASALGLELEAVWLPSPSLDRKGIEDGELDSFQGFFAAPGKTYTNPAGALAAIRFCRERLRPFMGT